MKNVVCLGCHLGYLCFVVTVETPTQQKPACLLQQQPAQLTKPNHMDDYISKAQQQSMVNWLLWSQFRLHSIIRISCLFCFGQLLKNAQYGVSYNMYVLTEFLVHSIYLNVTGTVFNTVQRCCCCLTEFSQPFYWPLCVHLFFCMFYYYRF